MIEYLNNVVHVIPFLLILLMLVTDTLKLNCDFCGPWIGVKRTVCLNILVQCFLGISE
jgi:glycopeptide antibiotics resistance protein